MLRAPSNLTLSISRDRASTTSGGGQPVPAPHYPYCKTLSPYIQPKSPLLQSETISPHPITIDPAKESVPFFLTAPSGTEGCYQVTSETSPLHTAQPQLSACPRIEVLSSGAFLWPSSGCAPTAPCLLCAEDSTSGSSSAPGEASQHRAEGQIPSPCWLCCFRCSRDTVDFLGCRAHCWLTPSCHPPVPPGPFQPLGLETRHTNGMSQHTLSQASCTFLNDRTSGTCS